MEAGRLAVDGRPAWTVTEYRGREALAALEADWRRLYAAMAMRTTFHAFDFESAYADHLAQRAEGLRFLVLSDRGRVRAICPLEDRSDDALGVPMRVWGVPSDPHVPVSDIVGPEDEARRILLPAITGYLRRHAEGRQLLVLGPLREDSVLWDGLTSLGARACFDHVAWRPYVFDCTRPFDELMSRLPRHFRKELRRCGRKLASLEAARFDSVSPTEDPDALAAFLQVEASGWKGRDGTGSAIRLHPHLTAFYERLATDLGAGDGCEVNTLHAEGRCVAGEFCMRTGDEYATLKVGYDEAYARLSPGHLLFQHTLQRCCEDPAITRFSQLSEAAWLGPWRADTVVMRRAYVALDRRTAWPLVSLLRFRFGAGRRAVRRVREAAASVRSAVRSTSGRPDA